MRNFILLLLLLLPLTVEAFDVGDVVTAKEGPDAGLEGRVIAIYNHDDQESFGIEFAEDRFGLYKEEDLEYHHSGIHPITDIEEEK